MTIRHLLIVLTIPALVAGIVVAPATGQEGQQPVTVGLRPADGEDVDPSNPQWLVASMRPGESRTFEIVLRNSSSQDVVVNLFLTDMTFSDDGTPQLAQTPVDIGTWGSFERPRVTVAPQQATTAAFRVVVPEQAEPGEHVAAVVAESEPILAEGSTIATVNRVATRLYVTVPGNAIPDLTITQVVFEQDSAFFPREATLTVTLRNAGRVRLGPTVTVNDEPASGPAELRVGDSKEYVVTSPIPFWGGPQSYRIFVQTEVAGRAGPVRQLRASRFVIPWHLLVLLGVAAALVYGLGIAWRKRGGRYEALQADMRRIERLLAMQAQQRTDPASAADDPQTAILAALKQARRSGNTQAEEKLKEQLRRTKDLKRPAPEPATTGSVVERLLDADGSDGTTPASSATDADPALRAILAEIPKAPADRRDALIRAARSYGAAELDEHPDLLDALPPEIRVKLFASRPPRRPQRRGRTDRRP